MNELYIKAILAITRLEFNSGAVKPKSSYPERGSPANSHTLPSFRPGSNRLAAAYPARKLAFPSAGK